MKNTRSEFEHPYNNVEVQKHLLACLISDPDAFATCRTIANPDYFDVQITNAARFIFDHTDQYGNIPSPDLIRAKTGLHLTPMDHDEMVRSREWLFTEFEGFCKYRALENLILDGVNLLRDGKPEEIVRRARDALTMSLLSDLGTSYSDVDPKQRLATMLDKTNIVSTGWKTLDAKLYGGFTRGALNVFCGYSGCVVAGTKVRVIKLKEI